MGFCSAPPLTCAAALTAGPKDNEYDGQLAKEGAGPAASGPGAVLLVHACASRESVRDRSSSRDRQLGWVGGGSRRSVRETLRRQVLALRQTQSHQPVHENGFDIVEVLLRVLQDGTCRTYSGRRSCHTVRPLDWPYLRKQKIDPFPNHKRDKKYVLRYTG